MPRGESPYLALAQAVVKGCKARAAFLYVDGGLFGDGWCVWAPPEVAARMPEFLDHAADEILAAVTGAAPSSRSLILPVFVDPQLYDEAAAHACRLTNAAWSFLFVLEGDRGTGWSVFAPPELNRQMVAELVHGFAEDLKREEPVLRGEAALH